MNNFSAAKSGIKDGINETRGCTDIIFLIIFFVFLGSLGYLTYYGNANGNIAKLIAPVGRDIKGNKKLCGVEDDFKTHRYLYLTEFKTDIADIFNYGVCVDSCPKSETETLASCQATNLVDCKNVRVYKTYTFFKYCVPDFLNDKALTKKQKEAWNAAWDGFLNSSAGSSVNDIISAKSAVWASIFMAPIYCFIFIAIMSAWAEIISWFCVALV